MNAARSTLIILLFLIPSWLVSQEIVDRNKLWAIAQVHCQPWGNTYSTQFFRFDGDTLVDDIAYKKVMIAEDEDHQLWNFFGAFIREVNGQVFYKELYQDEGLIYDFNLVIGDTVTINNSRALEELQLILTSVDTMPSENGSIEQWTLESIEFPGVNEIWFRGIGSFSGVMNSGIDVFGGLCGLYSLLCLEEIDTLKYQNPEFGSCYLYLTGIETIQQTKVPVIYYSAQSNQLKIEHFDSGLKIISITDISGRMISRLTTSEEKINIPYSKSTSGIIVVSIVHGQQVLNKKVVIR